MCESLNNKYLQSFNNLLYPLLSNWLPMTDFWPASEHGQSWKKNGANGLFFYIPRYKLSGIHNASIAFPKDN